MLEVVLLISSFFLFAYGFRMLVFLYVSRKHHSKSVQNALESAPKSMLINLEKNCKSDGPITNNENILLYDNSRKQFLQTDFQEKSGANYNHTAANSEFLKSRTSKYEEYNSFPVVSLIVATRNEESVIGNLLRSLEILTYDRSRFEIIIVDDSTDSTLKILEETASMDNLKIIKREQANGWKGGALNLALEYLRKDSAWVIILDADTILPPNIIEEFFAILINSKKMCNAIQGYCTANNGYFYGAEHSNWVGKGVEFRLAQRNMIEFVARDKLNLPVQITGSLFMIKTSIVKEIGFSTDLCEDWELTLQLYLRDHDMIDSNDTNSKSKPSETIVLFDENLNAGSQIPTSFSSYFKQRLRVSEGHTRGFIKMIPKLIKYKQPIKNKIEIFLTGFRYLIFVFILSLMLLDINAAYLLSSNIFNIYSIISFSIQLFCLLAFLVTNLLAINICNKSRQYDLTFLLSKFLLDFCIFPALIIGSLLGLLRKSGTFYRTQRVNSDIKNLSFI